MVNHRHDPNIEERNEAALEVSCSYCKAKVGQRCWALKDTNGPENRETYAPHRHRIKASWDKMFKERTRKKS